MKLFVLPLGTAEVSVPRFMPMDLDRGQFYTGPLTAFLIQTHDGLNVLFDSGPSPESSQLRPLVRQHPDDTVVRVDPDDSIVGRLEKLGVSASDVSHVIVSHFDYDHCGGNRYFPQARFHVQAEHMAWAERNPERCRRWDWDIPGLRYELLDGDVEVLPGIQVVTTPGHAPGHQSLVVRGLTNTGTVILTADAARTHRELEEERRGDVPEDDETIASIRKLKRLRDDEDALVLLSHDMEALTASYRVSPLYYD